VKTCERSRDRPRIVFSVPFVCSEATMSPATSARASCGSPRRRHDEDFSAQRRMPVWPSE
jgi:hypothetical protein